MLSDDGGIYVSIDGWMDIENPGTQIVIYTKGKTWTLNELDLNLNPGQYPTSVSHQIRLDEYELVPNALTDSTYLRILTNDSKEIRVHLASSVVEVSKYNPLAKFTEKNRLLKQYGVGLLIFIGLGATIHLINTLTR